MWLNMAILYICVANFMANLQHNTKTDMATVSIFLDTRRARKDGTFPVKLYVNHN